MIVGLTTSTTEINPVHDLVGLGNLNTFSDFDLVKENSLVVNSSQGGGVKDTWVLAE